jgi:hypothetical protein
MTKYCTMSDLNTYTNIHTYTHTDTQANSNKSYVYAYINTHKKTNIHTHTHTHTQTMGFAIEQVEKENKMFALVRATKNGNFPKTFMPNMAPPLKACQYKKR